MHFIDWLLVVIPLLVVAYAAFKAQHHVKDISDFLAAGRVAGRYVLAVSTGQAGMGLISLVAIFEMSYQSGFAIGFWGNIATPLAILVVLTGFLVYRFRETRAMTLSQFLEIRYSRKFRIFTGVLQAVSGIINYGLFPAVGAKFVVYYTDLPLFLDIAGFTIPTHAIVMMIFLGMAVLISTLGGQVTIMVTDCIQGILSYPMYLIVVIALMCSFSWWDHIAPVLLNRPEGQSFLDPFDTYKLQDFNLFYVVVSVFAGIYNMMSWSGNQGYRSAAITPHEQKMGAVLGTWRSGFAGLMYVLLPMAALVYMNHANFAGKSAITERNLQWQALNDVSPNLQYKGISASEELVETRKAQLDKKQAQMFKTMSNQMRVPVVLRDILPVGVVGVFCAIAIFLMLGCDSSYLHSWSGIIVQDIVLPLRKQPFTPKTQLFLLRLCIVGIAVYAYIFSLFFGQVTYILMFMALTGAVWLAGAGVVIIGGLYWKKGTTAAAWTSVIVGGLLAAVGFLGTQYWTSWIYPTLAGYPETLRYVTAAVESTSKPFEPIIMWRVTPDKFPLNGQEIFFLTMACSILSYVAVSLLTCKENFNMDRMLHRGQYRRKDEGAADSLPEKRMGLFKRFITAFVGIDADYTKGDRILAWSVFLYSICWGFGTWLIIVLWNIFIFRWPDTWWSAWSFISYFVISVLIGVVSTVWFFVGTTLDLKKMFIRLAARERNAKDDGRVIGHVSADEVEIVEQIEQVNIKDQ